MAHDTPSGDRCKDTCSENHSFNISDEISIWIEIMLQIFRYFELVYQTDCHQIDELGEFDWFSVQISNQFRATQSTICESIVYHW